MVGLGSAERQFSTTIFTSCDLAGPRGVVLKDYIPTTSAFSFGGDDFTPKLNRDDLAFFYGFFICGQGSTSTVFSIGIEIGIGLQSKIIFRHRLDHIQWQTYMIRAR